jgi:transcriptional regulator with XRE-family HTH domain
MMTKVESALGHYSYSQIAGGTGLSVSLISKLFNGFRPGRMETLERVAAFLKVGLPDLYAHLKTKRKAA